ncbi:hypothetical protein NMG60_11003856 [Bertholletia excelsa]
MCPLRFILVFFSAVLAGYFAWRSVSSSPEIHITDPEGTKVKLMSSRDKQPFDLRKGIVNGFWVFVHMASGRYLWRNLRLRGREDNAKGL